MYRILLNDCFLEVGDFLGCDCMIDDGKYVNWVERSKTQILQGFKVLCLNSDKLE
jgi:hypothetical protein